MLATYKESNEVFYPVEKVVTLTSRDIEELKSISLLNPRQRVRLCTHTSSNDNLHEMFIVHGQHCYVRPHLHLGKAESMAVIEGEVDVVLFHEDGSIRNVIRMGDLSSGKIFYYRLSDPIYHMLLIRTPFLVFHEVTEGPFIREKTVFPDWAPKENEQDVKDFISKIESLIIK